MVTGHELATAFLAHLAPSLSEVYRAEPDLPGQLTSMVARASERSGLSVEAEVFCSFVATRVSPAFPLSRLHVEDLYLACACAERISGAADALVQGHRAGLKRQLLPEFGDGAMVEDVLQMAFAAVLVGNSSRSPRIIEYSGKGPLGGWLAVVAFRTAIDLRRNVGARRALLGLEEILDLQIDNSDPDLARLQGRTAIKDAFRRALATLEPRVKTVLRLNALEGLNIEEIGQMYGVHRSTVARWIAQARTHLLGEVRTRLLTQLRLSDAELQSLLRLADDRLELSFSGGKFAQTESEESAILPPLGRRST